MLTVPAPAVVSAPSVTVRAPSAATVPAAAPVSASRVRASVPATATVPVAVHVRAPRVGAAVPCTATPPAPAAVRAPRVRLADPLRPDGGVMAMDDATLQSMSSSAVLSQTGEKRAVVPPRPLQ